MYDRIASKPGRVLIKPEDGSPSFYATITMADEPTQAGTPPIKANLLTDATANLLNLGTGATVNDALNALSKMAKWNILADDKFDLEWSSTSTTPVVHPRTIALNNDLRNYKEYFVIYSPGVSTDYSDVTVSQTLKVSISVNGSRRTLHTIAKTIPFGNTYHASSVSQIFTWSNGDIIIFPCPDIINEEIRTIYCEQTVGVKGDSISDCRITVLAK